MKIDGACQTLYVNSISLEDQPEYPGDIEIENKFKILFIGMLWRGC